MYLRTVYTHLGLGVFLFYLVPSSTPAETLGYIVYVLLLEQVVVFKKGYFVFINKFFFST